MPNESTQTIALRYKRCVYCGGNAEPIECGQVEEEETSSNWGKRRAKPKDKMRRKVEDK